jgi:hypothetical protein
VSFISPYVFGWTFCKLLNLMHLMFGLFQLIFFDAC